MRVSSASSLFAVAFGIAACGATTDVDVEPTYCPAQPAKTALRWSGRVIVKRDEAGGLYIAKNTKDEIGGQGGLRFFSSDENGVMKERQVIQRDYRDVSVDIVIPQGPKVRLTRTSYQDDWSKLEVAGENLGFVNADDVEGLTVSTFAPCTP